MRETQRKLINNPWLSVNRQPCVLKSPLTYYSSFVVISGTALVPFHNPQLYQSVSLSSSSTSLQKSPHAHTRCFFCIKSPKELNMLKHQYTTVQTSSLH